MPSCFRSSIYEALIPVGLRLYGRPLSPAMYRLPFGFYLRRGVPSLASKFRAEANTLRVVEQQTDIPAPHFIDLVTTPSRSYMLMTRVPGRPIGQQLSLMTDEQVKRVVVVLTRFVSQLRAIQNPHHEYQICNSEGGGILDWRVSKSQHEDMRFKDESGFNAWLTYRYRQDIMPTVVKSHGVPHEIFFTHGDLNMRNILAENGRITGIVDWENAGWLPEYWEYSKMHFGARADIRWLADVVDRVFEGYRQELWVENLLSDLHPF